MTAGATRAPTPVVIDCDPGHDDALAIALALARPELRVLGITTVAGNAALEHTTENALRILALLGRSDVPVARGAAAPLRGPLRTAPQVHGESGLEGADLPDPVSAPRHEDAVSFIASLLRESAEPVTLVPTGPLTNVARLVEAHRELLDRVAHICLMGGAIGEGNSTASAEFNIWVDPEAADIVFRAGRPITMVGLDVTHRARMTLADAAALAEIGTRAGRVFADLVRFFARFHRTRYGWDGSPIHDAVAVAHLLGLGLVATRPYPVAIETEGTLSRGRTVVDTRPFAPDPPNAEVALDIERDRFVRVLVEAVASYPDA